MIKQHPFLIHPKSILKDKYQSKITQISNIFHLNQKFKSNKIHRISHNYILWTQSYMNK